MLTANGVECKVVDVADNNCIDREVNLYKPTHVIIEALWVVPEKFAVLTKLHPKVKWLVRLHSEVPFIANEGMAFDWIPKLAEYPNVRVAANAPGICKDIQAVYGKEVVYLPNFYPIHETPAPHVDSFWDTVKKFFGITKIKTIEETSFNPLHIGCFGAIRPLKNQLIQAVAAMRFADSVGKVVHFHINGNRVEGKGDPVIKNIRKLFEGQSRHVLVEHPWMPHATFRELLKSMDMTLQVSFTETYNIVAADAIASGVPVITSDEIKFVPKELHASPTCTDDIIAKMKHLYKTDIDRVNAKSYFALVEDAKRAENQWMHAVLVEEAALL
jgi:glycosyltransferase involved in cell wall biosynthesis